MDLALTVPSDVSAAAKLLHRAKLSHIAASIPAEPRSSQFFLSQGGRCARSGAQGPCQPTQLRRHGRVTVACVNGTPSCGTTPWDASSLSNDTDAAADATSDAIADVTSEDAAPEIAEFESAVEEIPGSDPDLSSLEDYEVSAVKLTPRPVRDKSFDESRKEMSRSMREGLMPPWKQEGLLEDVSGLDNGTLVTADAVYNKELSWLAFNWRVLYMALDKRTPLLERLRFLAISARNLDEFFCKRVGALKRQEAAGLENLICQKSRAVMWSPTQTLKIAAGEVEKMVQTQISCLLTEILPALDREGIKICQWPDLSPHEQRELRALFRRNLEPLLTPLAVDPGHPFPFMSNMTLAIAVALRDPLDGDEEFAIVAVPSSCNRWVRVPAPGGESEEGVDCFISVEEFIIANLGSLFGGMEILSAHAFRVTRNADVERNEDEAEDLLEMINEEMRERKFAACVRLEVDCEMPEGVLLKLTSELGLHNKDDVYCICGPLALGEMDTIPVRLDPDSPLQFLPWVPQTHRRLQGSADIFEVIRQGDLLVHHPYQSFGTSVLQFVESAMLDPKVRAIKATLYRTSADSPIISALIKAAEYGKQVAVLVELKARFDEARNVGFAQKLENAGCHVAYGLVGLKTHCKCIMVVREEVDGCKTYVHIGTGNYNPRTAGVYTDFGLFSCDPDLGDDVRDLFKYLTGYHRQAAYKKLLVAPGTMRNEFVRLIDREIANASEGKPARVIVKCNGLDDEVMVRKLYEAAQRGVRVECIVRGMCRLRPGVPGVSENMRVVSILGRFLEHHRIFFFESAGRPKYYIGSADWMSRNLTRRVEVVTPVSNPSIKAELQAILDACLWDKCQAWDLQPDGRYRLLGLSEEYLAQRKELPRVHPESKLASAETIGLHQALMNLTMKRAKRAKKVSLKKKDGSNMKSRRFLESLYESSTPTTP